MDSVKISQGFQIVTPKNIREIMQLKPGQKMQVFQYGSRIELVHERPISEMRGFLKDMNTDFVRENDRT